MMDSIETMSKKELIDLYHKVGDRIRHLQQMEAQEKMNNFYFGDLVTFTDRDGKTIHGKVKRFNQKSVSVECEHGTRWTVSPHLLKKIPTGVLSAPYKVLGS
jgi:ribosomal protein L35AE/L33A